MTACGRRGKPKAGFPRASTVLGNRKSHDSHIPTAAARRGKVENQKQVSHFPTCCFFFPQNESERRPGGGSLRSRLQAHSWIRKCSGSDCQRSDWYVHLQSARGGCASRGRPPQSSHSWRR